MKYKVDKSIHINASSKEVKEHVEDFNKWNTWSPWTILDHSCEVEVEGIPGKEGHTMSWNGEVIGSGTNTLKEKDGNRLIYDLVFLAPFKSKALTCFIFEEKNGGTEVTWTMDSKMPFFLFFMVKMMKNWIGMDYERGLRMLKEIVEKGEIKAKTTNNGTVDYEGYTYIGIEKSLPIKDMPEVMGKDFEKIVNDVVVKKNKGAKHWITIYPKFNMKDLTCTYIAAISDEDFKDELPGEGYVRGEIESTKALEINHDGSYEFLGNAWSMGMMYMQSKKIKGGAFPFEEYWNSPIETRPDDLRTSIYFPLK